MKSEYKSQSERQSGYVNLVLKDVESKYTIKEVAELAIESKGYCHLAEVIARLALEVMDLNKQINSLKKKINKVVENE